MLLPTSLLFALAAAVNAAPPTAAPAAHHEVRRGLPSGWTLRRRADPETVVPLRFALTQSNTENLDAYLLAIADPASPEYGRAWTPARVAATFAPHPSRVSAVHAWLAQAINPARLAVAKHGASIALNASVAEAEALLDAEFAVFEHEGGAEHVACVEGYRLPEHVAPHVEVVLGAVQLPSAREAVSFVRRDGGPVADRVVGKMHRPDAGFRPLTTEVSVWFCGEGGWG